MENIAARVKVFFYSLTHGDWYNAFSIPISLVVIFVVFWFLRIVLMRAMRDKVSPAVKNIVRKVIFYAALVAAAVTVLNGFGVNLSAILGAAGIFGVALGFASQTSVSNIISGVFLLAGRSFKIGDTVQINSVRGTVESIDFLSVHLKSENGEFIRVPNESIIKANFTNCSLFPERRITVKATFSLKAFRDWQAQVSGSSDSSGKAVSGASQEFSPDASGCFCFVEKELLQASSCEGILSSPGAKVSVCGFRGDEFDVLLSVWCKNEDEPSVREKLLIRVADCFLKPCIPSGLFISASFL